jgi:hypothetical protein
MSCKRLFRTLPVGIVLFFLAASATTAFGETPRFECHRIAETAHRMGQTSLVDLDQDGDLDWLAGKSGDMLWFEYVSPNRWIEHTLGNGAKTDVGGCAFDIDGDGWIDQVAGDSWYRNTGDPRRDIFPRYETGAISCHDNIAADINGDGRLDLLACSNDRGQEIIAWYEIPENPRQRWMFHCIGTGIHGGVDPAGVGDLDGDGDNDVVRGNVWYENVDGGGLEWERHSDLTPRGGSRSDRFGLALKTWVIDLDADGDNDIVEAEADCKDGRVFWFENGGQGKDWTYHGISPEHTGQDFHSLALADFDNDGDIDVFSGGGPLSDSIHRCFIWENTGEGDSLPTWEQHLLTSGIRCHEAKAADVDGDGDIDICTKPWRGGTHIYLRNMLMEDKP